MKLRVKYTKTGAVRFIGHLDVMRHFQKAIRRAKLDIAYTQGFSPHQILSFAAPMPLGMTSEGEYFDAEFVSAPDLADMMKRLNDTMPPEIQVTEICELPEKAKAAMAAVSSSDYVIYRHEEAEEDVTSKLALYCKALMEQPEILVTKKTKSKEELSNIRPLIYNLAPYDKTLHGDNRVGTENGIYMHLATGSVDNLKPELAIFALCEKAGVPYNRYDYMVHRLETYMEDPEDKRSLTTF